MTLCKRCQHPFAPEEMLEGFCTDCIFALANDQSALKSRINRAEIERAKQAVEAETSGLFAAGLLDVILDELLDNVEGGEDRELAKTKAKSEIQGLGGIGVCREVMKFARALSEFSQQAEEEAQRKLGILIKLRKGDKP